MKQLYRIFLIMLVMCGIKAVAQSNIHDKGFPSGDYDELKVSCDTILKTFTMVDDSNQGAYSCSLFLSGSLVKNKDGKYPVKAYPYGFNNKAFDGTIFFREGKNGHKGILVIQISETGACENMANYKSGLYLPLDKAIAYPKFDMIKVAKAMAYGDSLLKIKKGYFVERDFVSILKETADGYYVTYLKNPSFMAWVKKIDLIL